MTSTPNQTAEHSAMFNAMAGAYSAIESLERVVAFLDPISAGVENGAFHTASVALENARKTADRLRGAINA